MSMTQQLPDAQSTALEQIDVSDPRLYEQDAWRPFFERLRKEQPIHYQANSAFGPFWSVTRFEDIVAVDSNHEVFSSQPTIVIGDLTENRPETADDTGLFTMRYMVIANNMAANIIF